MTLNFKDNNLFLTYMQIKLKEEYNSKINVNDTYYTIFNSNYGFAHFIAKYLNMMYPPMDTSAYAIDLPDDTFNSVRPISECISIFNYFLCDNKGNKLTNDLMVYPATPDDNSMFQQIYGTDICAIYDVFDQPILTPDYPKYDEEHPDIPFSPYSNRLTEKIKSANMQETITANAKAERIYNLSNWIYDKNICEIDDLVASYLLGRTITPNSSMEDIYYVQTLLIGNTINNSDKGKWISDSGNLTELIIDYQKSKVNEYSIKPIFVTGYFDIYTESAILQDRGEFTNGIVGI